MPEFGSPSINLQAKMQKAQQKTGPEIFQQYLKKDNRLRMEDFADVYPREEIAQDKKDLREMIESETYDASDVQGGVLENLVVDIAERHLWFGEREYFIVQLSEYDDKMKKGAHADAVLEARDGNGEVIRIGIDFTLAENIGKLEGKREKCIQSVLGGNLPSAKYYQSELTGEKGRVGGIPVVMAGIDREGLHNLCEAVAKKDKAFLERTQLMFLDEMLHQMDNLVAIAMDRHGSTNRITAYLEQCREFFIEALKQKESLRSNDFNQEAARDHVYSFIMKH